jgi:uncharacterized repeat protein (TIGR02543 family)
MKAIRKGTARLLTALVISLVIISFMVPLTAASSGEIKAMVSTSFYHTVGLRSNGTVVASGSSVDVWGNPCGQLDVNDWTDIIQVAAGAYHTVGLKADGTVVAVGDNSSNQCDVSSWTGITQIAAGSSHTVGLKSDGTVVAAGENSYHQCDVNLWENITQVSAGQVHTIGLKSDGTVVAVGNNHYHQCYVTGLTGIVQVSAGLFHSVYLKSDGKVVAVGDNDQHQCNVFGWTGITQVSGGGVHTLGLKSDGTVVAVGNSTLGQCSVGQWTDIVQVEGGYNYSLGLKKNGTVVATSYPSDYATLNKGQLNVSGWMLRGYPEGYTDGYADGQNSQQSTIDDLQSQLNDVNTRIAGLQSQLDARYTITFDSQGGSEIGGQTIYYRSLVYKPDAPTLNGKVFGGWFKEETCENPWNFASDTVTEDIDLYARWLSPAKAGTTTAITSSANPATAGQSVTFTATISSDQGTAAPAGTVTFSIDGAEAATVDLSGSKASYITSTLSYGSHAVSAVYSGDADFSGSTGSLNQMVTNTTVTLTTSATSANAGQKITLTAKVKFVGDNKVIPTGTVRFYDTVDGSIDSPLNLNSAGVASLTVTGLSRGAHTISAEYTSDNDSFTGSNSLPNTVTITIK